MTSSKLSLEQNSLNFLCQCRNHFLLSFPSNVRWAHMKSPSQLNAFALSVKRRHPLNQDLLPLLSVTSRSKMHNNFLTGIIPDSGCDAIAASRSNPSLGPQIHKGTQENESNFWAAVSLIIGTAVGPGMLGLPAAYIKSGPLPSTASIILAWIYVISSILIVAELSCAVMKEDRVAEVSFTGIAGKTLGNHLGSFVAVVYASLSFSLLVACISGIGSIISQWFPGINLVISNALFPAVVATALWLFPFNVIDAANRFLCLVMVCSISALVTIGLSVGRSNVLSSFGHASWSLPSILPAIPLSVLTLGFHVITPFVCKIAGNTAKEARTAVLVGGSIPLLMVLSWNLIVLGLAGINTAILFSKKPDPITLLLSVNPSARLAVQCFAFSALATSLIGYAVSFPKQLVDTLELVFVRQQFQSVASPETHFQGGKVGTITFRDGDGHEVGAAGRLCYHRELECYPPLDESSERSNFGGSLTLTNIGMIPLVLGVPVMIASSFPSTFAKALDYAGIYANCFLFGILPPVMAYIYQSRKRIRSGILPGGNITLFLLFAIAVALAIWH